MRNDVHFLNEGMKDVQGQLEDVKDVREKDELEAWLVCGVRIESKEERQEELVEEAKEEVTAKNDEEEIVIGARQPYTSSSFLALYLLQLVH